MRDLYLAQRAESPTRRGAVHRIDEPASAVLLHRMDGRTDCAFGRNRCKGHALSLVSDSYLAAGEGDSPREQRKAGERVRECSGERLAVETSLKEEDQVHRHVRERDVTDVATDFEALWAQRADQLGRHSGLPSAADYYAAAKFRRIRDSPEMRLLVGGGIGVDPKILQNRPQHDVHFGDREIRPDAAACSASERQPCGCRLIG